MTELKEKTISGMIWSAVERFGYTFIMFLSNLFLARLLNPNDFGLVGMIIVFVSIASIIVDGGFTSALIQKKTISNEDYSTAFHVNVILAIVLYSILYFSAPYISDFYSEPLLSDLLRILGVILIINALSVVQIAKIKRELNFRYLGFVSIVSSFVGCGVGVICAFFSFGVWSLIIQTLTISTVKSVILFISSSWKPSWKFSRKALKMQFSFGSMILSANLLDTIYVNSVSLIIGKSFSSKILGLYTQARAIESVPNQTLITIVGQVTFPVFSRLQDKPNKLLDGVRKVNQCLTWINFPLMVLLIIIAEPLFRILYTDKWIDAVPLFQIACFGGIMLSANAVNGNVLTASGNSSLFFRAGLYKRLIGIILVVIGLYFGGLWGVMYVGVALVPYVFFVINVFYTRKVLDYGYKRQIKDIFPIFFISIMTGIISVGLSSFFIIHLWGQFVLLVLLYGFIYVLLSIFLKIEAFKICLFEIRHCIDI